MEQDRILLSGIDSQAQRVRSQVWHNVSYVHQALDLDKQSCAIVRTKRMHSAMLD